MSSSTSALQQRRQPTTAAGQQQITSTPHTRSPSRPKKGACATNQTAALAKNERPELKQPDEFSEQQWLAFTRRTGVLRGWRENGHWAHKIAFTVSAEHLHDVCQPVNDMAEGDLSRTEARSGTFGRSAATDKGGNIGGGGGVPGAQGSVNMALAKQTGVSATAERSDQRQEETHKGKYKAMTLFLWPDYLELSPQCIAFFTNIWIGTPETALMKFQEDFGTSFYRTVDLGVSREEIFAVRQDQSSESLSQDLARQLDLGISGNGPNANANIGMHRNTERHAGDATSASADDRTTSQYSHGGAANIAHIDDDAWRTSLLDPTSWVVLRDGRHDVTTTLQVINEVAERVYQATYDHDAGAVYRNSRNMLEHVMQAEIQERDRLEQLALEASRHTITIMIEVQEKRIVITVPEYSCMERMNAVLQTMDGSTERLTFDTPTGVNPAGKRARSTLQVGKSEIIVGISCSMKAEWSLRQAFVNGGLPSHQVTRSRSGGVSTLMAGVTFGSGSVTNFVRGAVCTASPPSCQLTAILSPGPGQRFPGVECRIEVVDAGLHNAVTARNAAAS